MALPIVCGHAGNKYQYIGKLQAMEECSVRRNRTVPEGLGQIVTPLAKEVWQEELNDAGCGFHGTDNQKTTLFSA